MTISFLGFASSWLNEPVLSGGLGLQLFLRDDGGGLGGFSGVAGGGLTFQGVQSKPGSFWQHAVI